MLAPIMVNTATTTDPPYLSKYVVFSYSLFNASVKGVLFIKFTAVDIEADASVFVVFSTINYNSSKFFGLDKVLNKILYTGY